MIWCHQILGDAEPETVFFGKIWPTRAKGRRFGARLHRRKLCNACLSRQTWSYYLMEHVRINMDEHVLSKVSYPPIRCLWGILPVVANTGWIHRWFLWLVGGLEHGFMTFHISGMSSSRLTNSIIFQRGRSTTNQIWLSNVYWINHHRPLFMTNQHDFSIYIYVFVEFPFLSRFLLSKCANFLRFDSSVFAHPSSSLQLGLAGSEKDVHLVQGFPSAMITEW